MLSMSLPVAAAMAFRNSGSRSMGSSNAAAESAKQQSSARGWRTTLPHPQECSKRSATSYLPSRWCNLRAPRRLSGPQTRNGPGYASCAGPSRSVSGMACRTSCTQAAAPAAARPPPAAVRAGLAQNFRPKEQRTGDGELQIASKRGRDWSLPLLCSPQSWCVRYSPCAAWLPLRSSAARGGSASIVSRRIVSSALSGSRAWAPRRAAGAGLARGTTDQGAALAAL
jgi:hypothetical protein